MFPRILSIIICLCFLSRAFAQSRLPVVSPIPPDAAALFKVVGRPVGTYTGTVPVNFPLATISSGPLTANIALNYNSAGGVKVEEFAGTAGLGFSLADGAGRITQVVRGLPDDRDGILNNHYTTRPSNWNCTNMLQVDQNARGDIDLEPDEYYYNFNGRSGRFFLKENGAVVLRENAGIKITYSFDDTASHNINIKQWTITDENGNKYYFGQNKAGTLNYHLVNLTTSLGPSGSTRISSVSWFLTEANDMNEANKLKYSYVQSGTVLNSFSGAYMPLDTRYTNCTGFDISVNPGGVVVSEAEEYVVSRIDASSGYILFNTTADRLDASSRKLNMIEIYDTASVLKKQIKFNYGYFSESIPNIRRLKLKGFSEFHPGSTDSLSYKFDYEESQNLPTRMSASVDLWGFYNGAFNSTIFPNIVYISGDYIYRRYDMANRNANGTAAQANILKKITYPTGGYRSFVYEGNTILGNTSFTQYHPDPLFMANQSFTRTDFTNVTAPMPCLSHQFTVNSADGGAQFTYFLSSSGTCTGYNVTVYRITVPGQPTGGAPVGNFTNMASAKVNLPNGYYRLDVKKPSSSCTMTQLQGMWVECTLSNATIATPNGTFYRNNRNAGGVRIQEIKDYDPISGKTNSTLYKYKLYSTDSNFTSGLLVSPVNLIALEDLAQTGCSFARLLPQSYYPLATQDGAYVVYPEVRTIENDNGWIDNKFTYFSDVPGTGFPQVPNYEYGIYRGLLLSQQYFNQAGVLVRRIINNYSYINGESQQGVRAKAYWPGTISDPFIWSEFRQLPPNDKPTLAACQTYSVWTQTCLLAQTIDSSFAVSGNIASNKVFQYVANNAYYTLGREITVVSNGQSKITTYKYPFTANTAFSFPLTAAEQTMKTTLLNKNFLQPIETADTLQPVTGTGTLLSGIKYTYGTYNTSNIQLSQVRTYSTGTKYTEVNLSGYDGRGNLTEMYKTNDVKEVYLWGYNSQYPVAKVSGSDLATVKAFVNATILNAPTSDAQLRTELDKIRAGLAATKAMVTTYTYLPLIGITSATDPSGKTVFYEYDAFGRLMHIRDQNNNILKKYEYKYAGAL